MRCTNKGWLLIGAAILGTIAPAVPAAAQSIDERRTFNIEAQSVGDALLAFSRQSGIQVITASADIGDRRTRAVRGTTQSRVALDRLLTGTGLSWRQTAKGSIVVEPMRGEDKAAGAAADTESAADIIVTGTNIRGVTPDSSPLTVLSRREIDARGATTAEQVINTLTQNFNSVNANGVAADRAGYLNGNALNGIDLRGLGPGTTLVLLNGRRLSGSSNGQVVDVSQIPLAAVGRIDILTDSASSVYGSDAVGGVVNFVLLDRFEGVEARAGYGTTDDGAQHEWRGSLTGGLNWSTGNLVASTSYLKRSELTADERSFSKGVLGHYSLSPPEERAGLFLSARQELGERLTIHADGLYNRRSGDYLLERDLGLLSGRPYRTANVVDFGSQSWFGSLNATYKASDALSIDVTGSYSRVSDRYLARQRDTIFDAINLSSPSRSRTYDLTARASGRLLPLPGGDLAFSLGGGLSGESLISSVGITRFVPTTTTTVTRKQRDRTTRYAYGELSMPIVGPAMGISGIDRLELNASARYSDYSDFGEDFSPKLGLLWVPTPGFNLRGSYGRTFRAPYLSDIGGIGTYQILNVGAFGLPNPRPGAPPIGLYVDSGTDPQLGPETSNLLALGMDLRPPSIPRLQLSLTYVSIDYKNRIARGDPARGSGYYYRPALYPELYNLAPTRADFAAILANSVAGTSSNVSGFNISDPDALAANVSYILDNRLRNIAQSRQQAIDVTASYAFTRGAVDYSLGANATLILEADARLTPSSVVLSQINILGRPVDLRANAYAGLSSGGFSSRLTARYVDDYANPYIAASPKIGDWLTFDLSASYDFGKRTGPLSGLAVYLSVQNLFDRDPPFVADFGPGIGDGLSEPIGFDPANATAFGRYISIELRKRF
jgi:iron complex outermembrane receptor protein